MLRLYVCFLALLVSVVVSGCAPPVTSPSAMGDASIAFSIAQLEGSWIVTAIQPASGQKQDRPLTATYTLTFKDGRLSTRADCNSCAGPFWMNGTTLTAGPVLACTRAACPTATFEYAYTAILGGDSATVLTSSTLTLTSTRGSIWLVRQD